MIIRTNKKRPVFSKFKDVVKNRIDLTPEYLKSDEFFDEDTEVGESQSIHKILIKIPIDKLQAVKNEVAYIDGYLTRDVTQLMSRDGTFAGFTKSNKQHINFAILNKEQLARESFKRKQKKADITKVFGVDIASRFLANVKVSDIKAGFKSEVEIFGEKDVYIVHNSEPKEPKFDPSTKRTSELNHLFLSSRLRNENTLGSFSIFEQKRKQQLADSTITRPVFKRRYNKLKMSGIDPAVEIYNSSYNSQNLLQMVKGVVPENFKSNKRNTARLEDQFHQMIEGEISESKLIFKIKKEKRSKRHEALHIIVSVSQSLLERFNDRQFDILVYAKDKQKRIIDHHKITINLDTIKTVCNMAKLTKNINNYELMCQRSINQKSIVKIINHTEYLGEYSLYSARLSSLESNYLISFQEDGIYNVENGSGTYVYTDSYSPTIGKHTSILYRVKPTYQGVNFANTKFDQITSVSQLQKGSLVSMKVENDKNPGIDARESVTITLSDLPEDCLAFNLAKRNLTKKEKKFSIIKNLRASLDGLSKNLESKLVDLQENRPVFTARDIPESLKFVDNDVESGDTYEYKAVLYRDNCEQELAVNSYINTYERKLGLVNIALTSKSLIEPGLDVNTISFEFKVSIENDAVENLFSSLDRNSFDLLSEELKELKESLKKSVSCKVILVEKNSCQKIDVGEYFIDENARNMITSQNFLRGKISFSLDIPDPTKEYFLVLEPRVATASYLIENVLDKIDRLPSLQKSFPISLYHRTDLSKKIKDKKNNQKIVSSYGLNKYSSKSVRFFGTILDKNTRFNKEKDEFYYEGSTGDTLTIDIYKPTFLKSYTPLTFLNFVDMSRLSNFHGKNNFYEKYGLLKLKGETSRFIDFYCIYTKSNGTVTFHGMIHPDILDEDDFITYNFYINFEKEVGLTEIYTVAVLKDGTVTGVDKLADVLCTNDKIKVIN